MQRSTTNNDVCYDDLNSEEQAAWRANLTARQNFTTFTPPPKTVMILTTRFSGFTVHRDSPSALQLHFRDTMKLVGDKHFDSLLLNAISYVLNAIRSSGLAKKEPISVHDLSTDEQAYEGVMLGYQDNVDTIRLFQQIEPVAKLEVILKPGFVEIILPDHRLLDQFVEFMSDLKLPVVANADNYRSSIKKI